MHRVSEADSGPFLRREKFSTNLSKAEMNYLYLAMKAQNLFVSKGRSPLQ